MAYKICADQFRHTSIHWTDETQAEPERLSEWIAESSVEPPVGQTEPVPIDTLIYGFSEERIRNIHPKENLRFKSPVAVSMDLADPECGIPGIYQSRPDAGAMAVEWLHNTLMTSHVGIERRPAALLVPGRWLDGRARLHAMPAR